MEILYIEMHGEKKQNPLIVDKRRTSIGLNMA